MITSPNSASNKPSMSLAFSQAQQIPINWISWPKFTKVLDMVGEQSSSIYKMTTLLKTCTQLDDQYQLWLTLKNGQYTLLSIKNLHQPSSYSFKFYTDDSFAHKLMSLKYQDQVFTLKSTQPTKPISKKTLTKLFEAIHISFQMKVKSPEETETIPTPELTSPRKEDTNDDIKWFSTLEKFEKKIAPVKTMASFVEKTNALKKMFSHGQDNIYKLWVSYGHQNKNSVLIAFEETSEFVSNTFSQNAFIPQRPKKDDSFVRFCFYDNPEMDKVLFSWRISQKGAFSELVYIEASKTLRGNDTMMLFEKLRDTLSVKHTILQDASKDPQTDLPLRALYTLTHPERQTWYMNYGFDVFECEGVLNEDETFTYHQSKATHQHSIDTLCDTTLKTILDQHDQTHGKHLLGLYEQYKTKDSSLEKYSLSDLGQSMYSKLKAAQTKKAQKSVRRDLCTLYCNFLAPKDKAPSQATELEQAVQVIHDTRLFIKSVE